MKPKLLFVLAIFFVGFLCNNVKAYSLNDAVVATLQNNEKIKAAKKELEIAILSKPKVVAEFLPNISVELNQTFHKNRNFPSLQQQPTQKYIRYHQGSLIWYIEQEIYSGGSTIAKIAAADAEINAAYQTYNKKLNEVIYYTIQVYQSVLTSRECVKVQTQNVDIAAKHVEKAKIKVNTGEETKTSLYLAKAAVAEMKSMLEEYKTQQIEVEAYFQFYIGEEVPEKIETIDLKKYKVPIFKDFKALVSQKNPEILTARSTLKASKQGINIAASGLMPKISLFGQILRQDGPTHLGDNLLNSQIRKDGDTYGIKMIVPIFNRGLNYISISEARKKEKYAEHALKDTLNKVQADTTSTWQRYISSGSVYDSSRQAEENHYKTYLSMKAEFEVGAKTIFDVIQRQKEYNSNTIVRLKKEHENRLALFKIYQLIGNLPQTIKSDDPVIK